MATSKKPAAGKKSASKPITEPLGKSGLVAYLAEHSGVEPKGVRAVLATLEQAVSNSVNKKGAGQFTLPGLLKITAVAVAAKPKRKGHGRKPLPKDLPRRRVEHTLPEAARLCPCCAEPCAKFAEDVNEQLDYKPASLFVWQHVRFKYACQKCHDHVTVAPAPVAVVA